MAKKHTQRKTNAKPRRKSSTRSPAIHPGVGLQRLNKILAAAGLGSRREVEELIVQGRVDVDRETVTDLGRKVDPSQVTIQVDGQALKKFRPVYFALNKPKGVLSTNADPSGRMRVIDLVPDKARVFSVGRLDKSSEGLMLLTNDGELANKIAHPKYRIQKTYYVVVAGFMTNEELAKLRKGVYLAEGFARIDGATIRKQRKGSTELEISLSEGKNREIRRILARAGHKVVVLRRIAIGPLRLGQLPVGASRELTSAEVKALYAATSSTASPKKKSPGGKKFEKSTKTHTKPPQETSAAVTDFDEADWDDDEFSGFDAEAYDDDFVTVFGDATSEGSVLAYDEQPTPSSGRSSKPSKGRGKNTARSSSAGGKASGRRKSSHKSAAQPSATQGTQRPASKRAGKSTSRSSSRSAGRPAKPAAGPGNRKKPAAKRGAKKKR